MRHPHPYLHAFQVALLAAALGVLTACASTKHDVAASAPPGPVWPPPPAQARVAYLESISGPADIGQGPSVWNKVSTWLSGNATQRDNLVKPFGLALDDQTNLCLTDTAQAAVYYCDFARRKWRRWDMAGKTRFVSPVAVAARMASFMSRIPSWEKC